MAKKANRRNQANPHKEFLTAHATRDTEDALRVKLDKRRSGAAGAHATSGVAPQAAAGRKTRVGSRSSQLAAAVQDNS